MNPLFAYHQHQTRRQFFGASGLRLGSAALALLAGPRLANAAKSTPAVHPPLPGFPQFAPRAKSIIYLHLNGGPSQLDTWDYKPQLQEQFDKDLPDSIRAGQRITTMTSGQSRLPVAPSIFRFQQYGECGTWASELMDHTARFADDIAVVKTVHTNAINHDPACTFVMTGSEIPGRPSLGSWISYGIGAETSNLPAFVVLTPSWSAKGGAQALFTRMWESGFLPTRHAGVALRSAGDPVLYLRNPHGVHAVQRLPVLDALTQLNQRNFERTGDPEVQTRISQYEMAFRMQNSMPDLVDLSGETQATLDLYGPDVQKPGTFAASALLARRLVERGVRVVQVLHRGWDQHLNLPSDLRLQCSDIDQATGGLLADLKRRGLLDSTLVVWGGEFGRTVYSQGKLTATDYGRDHHPRNFVMWLAGGGVRGGQVYGETDDFSYNVVDKPVHLNDLNATLLHCLGIDHETFTYPFQGLDMRLTGVEPAHVVEGLLA